MHVILTAISRRLNNKSMSSATLDTTTTKEAVNQNKLEKFLKITQFHVLAVDDSLIDRKLIERLLKTSSYQVTVVDSEAKALEFLGLIEDDKNDLSKINNCLEKEAEDFFLKPVQQSDVN
ncbi:two-component response regulator ORR9-like [Olea europaea var. sylvestris]|uniref:two-component response regulator ORR9-like n=1 Tax=Olea europaea var. sylvestris TaxID=158386 RepID=UPI000C1D3869|nr:two-component response regulator ORR9-like [Olea europaea var. sylvestris]